MTKVKYRYNPKTCKYEPTYLKGRALQDRVAIFLGLSFVFAGVFYVLFTHNFESLEEQLLQRENIHLKTEWQVLEDRIHQSAASLATLVDRDDNNYRVILDTAPLPTEIRESGTGGSERFSDPEIKNSPTLFYDYAVLDKLKNKVDVEQQSFTALQKMLNDRIRMWASRPAIQPINNKQLNQLHLSYGSRLHPVFNVFREHNGLDFSAPKGTPVYATGDGKVTMAYRSGTYGNVIYINHGHGYETRYAHLSGFAAKPGDKVKRGHIIGYVGSTGTSSGYHLHYEVLVYDKHVNPINFFQRDLSNKEYERLIEIGATQNKALD